MGEAKIKKFTAPMDDSTGTVSISESRLSEVLAAGQVEQVLMDVLNQGIQPNSIHAKQMKAMLFLRQKKFDECEKLVAGILRMHPEDGLSNKMMGDMSFLKVDYKSAQKWYSEALKILPNHPDIVHDLAVAIVSEGRVDESIPLFRKACLLKPQDANFKHHLAIMLVLAGKIHEGWAQMESRLDVPGVTGSFPNPEKYWQGQDLAGKVVVVRSEQGFGDTIMFMRYVKLIKEMGAAKIYAYCQPNMREFLQHYYPECIYVPNIAPPPTDFDFHVCVMSFPHLFPGQYLTERASKVEGRDGIGINWFGSPTHKADHLRTVPIERFLPMMDRYPREKFYCTAWGRFSEKPPRIDYYIDNCRDWLETAQKIDKLKLIITVDTAIAHLGGFLGVPTWLLLPYVPDFRWGMSGETTPWYESVKIYRQPKLFDWDSVFARVEEDLGAIL